MHGSFLTAHGLNGLERSSVCLDIRYPPRSDRQDRTRDLDMVPLANGMQRWDEMQEEQLFVDERTIETRQR